MMELLSPAGSFEALQAAVCAGADAVYLGATAFSARASAANFDEAAMPRAISYAHLAGVKVLVTVNTLIFPREMDDAIALALRLRDAGADGLIVQDLGLAQVLRSRLGPDVPLHASTQATVHNLPGVLEMARRGFRRVVLARELSLEDLAPLCRESPVELEVFAHGALCVSCSGACLMSSMIGGRSGNRGRCAQPCRLPYRLLCGGEEAAQGALLSPRDLMTLPFLGELRRLGVASLKIEGRLKRPEYVTLTTRAYRRALDALEELGHYEPTPDCLDALMRIFNRGGFSRGYFYGVQDAELIHAEQSGHTGVEIGRVTDAAAGLVEAKESLRPGDGLQLRPSGEGIAYAGRPQGPGRVHLALPRGISTGERLFKTTDARLMEAARCDGQLPRRPLSMEAELIPGCLPLLTLRADGLTVTVQGSEPVQAARSRALTREDAARQLGKTDTYPWQLASLALRGEGAFMPVSALNALRRQGLEALAQALLEARRPMWSRNASPVKPGRPADAFIASSHPALMARVLTADQAEAALAAGADGVYLSPEDWTALPSPESLAALRRYGKPLWLQLPLWLTDRSLVEVNRCLIPLRPYLDGLLAPNVGTACYFLQQGYHVAGDAPMNAANAAAVRSLLDLGLTRITLSPELTCAQAREAAQSEAARCEGLIHGPVALMHLVHCPLRAARGLPGTGEGCRACGEASLGLRDRKGLVFPLRHTRLSRCQMTLYNALPLDTSAALDRLPALGTWRLTFLDEPAAHVRETVSLYRRLRDGEITAPPPSDHPHTTGHWFRGVE